MKVVIINGLPRSGKDTFVGACTIAYRPGIVYNVSTVDFVKDVARFCGWEGKKEPKDRKFLSDLKDILTEWNEIPMLKVKERLREIEERADLLEIKEPVVFIMCREPKEIEKLKNEFNATTVFIQRDAVEGIEQSNHADADVFDYNYDITIHNNGNLSALNRIAESFMNESLKGVASFALNY